MRSTTETLQLDLSLRQSRTIYVSLALVFLPLAATGIVYSISAIGIIVESLSNVDSRTGLGGAFLTLVMGVVFAGVEYAAISQTLEANRRLKILRENPEQTVRKLPAPFQSSLFGPYH